MQSEAAILSSIQELQQNLSDLIVRQANNPLPEQVYNTIYRDINCKIQTLRWVLSE